MKNSPFYWQYEFTLSPESLKKISVWYYIITIFSDITLCLLFIMTPMDLPHNQVLQRAPYKHKTSKN